MVSQLSYAYASHLSDLHENVYEDDAICYEVVLFTWNKNTICLLPFSRERFVFCLLSKNINTRIDNTVILPVVLYGRETWSLTLRQCV
jgi:hypothetical protein